MIQSGTNFICSLFDLENKQSVNFLFVLTDNLTTEREIANQPFRPISFHALTLRAFMDDQVKRCISFKGFARDELLKRLMTSISIYTNYQ